jgi:hypothetical protein
MIHGLLSAPITFLPLKMYLQNYGYKNLHGISYPVNRLSFEDSLAHVNKEIEKIHTDKNREIILIGQSFGGVISNNLHKFGWKIRKAIYICSPLHGASIINSVESIIPASIANLLNIKPFDHLKTKKKDSIPPHDFHTISFGCFAGDFDGSVYEDEAKLMDEKHTHIPWSHHVTGFLDPRLFKTVYEILDTSDNCISEYQD